MIVYPNPTSGQLNIRLEGNKKSLTEEIDLFDVSGSLIKRIKLNNDSFEVNVSLEDISTGVYFLHLHFSDGSTFNKKIIKK